MTGHAFSLAATLDRFDRKERNWLLRTALDSLEISPSFLREVETVVRLRDPDFDPSSRMWWAIDYHVDWLVAVLHLLKTGMLEPHEPMPDSAYGGGQIRGTQQDIDLVIATGDTLILIEAKGLGSWTSGGIVQKIERLRKFGLLLDENGRCGPVRVHLVLCSPDEPRFDGSPAFDWPAWTHRAGGDIPPWVRMTPNRPADGLLDVCRSNPEGRPDRRGGWWTIRSVRTPRT